MELIKLHPNAILPERGSDGAGGYDIFMPEAGGIDNGAYHAKLIRLGFAMKVPEGYVALLLPRSGAGAKQGVELRNTCGVIDSDYEGEWMASIKTKEGHELSWAAGERLLQFVIVPCIAPAIEVVTEFSKKSERGAGGFGSTGQ